MLPLPNGTYPVPSLDLDERVFPQTVCTLEDPTHAYTQCKLIEHYMGPFIIQDPALSTGAM